MSCFVVLSVQMFGDCQMSGLMSDNMSGYLLLTRSKKMSVHNCFISFWTCQIRGFSIWVRSASCKFGLGMQERTICQREQDLLWLQQIQVPTMFWLRSCFLTQFPEAWRDVCWYESQSAAMYQWLNIDIAWNTLNRQTITVFSCNQHTENKMVLVYLYSKCMVYLYSKCQQTRGCFN